MALFDKILSGVPILGDVAGQIISGARNRKSRKFAREMYDKQKADQIAFWNMANKYNAPSAEMARLKAAGLNPALMYGQGAEANRAGAIGKPQALSAASSTAPISTGSVLQQYNQTRIADKQIELLEAETIAKKAQAFKDLWSGKTGKFDLGLKEENRTFLSQRIFAESRTATAQASIQSIQAGIEEQMYSSGKKLEVAMANALYSQLKNDKVKVDIKQVKAAIRQLVSQTQLNRLEKELRQTTGQSFSTGTIIGPLIRALYSIIKTGGMRALQ